MSRASCVWLLLLLPPETGQAQQLLIVPCQRNNDGVILFHQEALPLIPERHRWALERYEPIGSAGSVWQPGECTVQEVPRR